MEVPTSPISFSKFATSVIGPNANVIIPFAAALEEVCEARGYILNIFGEKSNIVFTGDEADARAIYALVEEYLAAK